MKMSTNFTFSLSLMLVAISENYNYSVELSYFMQLKFFLSHIPRRTVIFVLLYIFAL